jgi:hypothetical protein
MKLIYLALLGVLPMCAFSQTVTREPQNVVRTDTEKKANGDVVIIDGHRQIKVHPDGSRTIIVKSTQVSPDRYISTEAEENTSDLSSMIWTKEDLELYIKSLKLKKSNVESDPTQHAKALENGWYDFMNRMIRESEALLESLK